ncbi:TPA: hypothetical protein JBK16_17410, partial [Legionella pneumophila]|nr:hypothetical protein [Legionella pneumophila]
MKDEAFKLVRDRSKKEWKIKSKYQPRSFAETGVFLVKTLMRNKLTACTFECHYNEWFYGVTSL